MGRRNNSSEVKFVYLKCKGTFNSVNGKIDNPEISNTMSVSLQVKGNLEILMIN